MNSLRLKRSSELKWILCIILFQLFIDLIFIELEPNIWVLVLGILSKYCCDTLVLWLCSSLNSLKNWSKTGRLLVRLSKTNRQLFRMILFFKLLIFNWWYQVSEGSINCLKLKALFWARWIISNVLLCTCPQMWHAYFIWESKKA